MKKRIFRTKAQIIKHLDDWRKSGLSKTKFCTENDIHPNSFTKWEKKYGKEVTKNNFALVRLVPEKKSKPLTLILNDKLKIEINQGFDEVLLKKLLLVLETI